MTDGLTSLGKKKRDHIGHYQGSEGADDPQGEKRTKRGNEKQRNDQQPGHHDGRGRLQDQGKRDQRKDVFHHEFPIDHHCKRISPGSWYDMTIGNAITIRPALQRDAADLAIIDNLASHGMSLAFWQHAVDRGEAEDALAHGRNRFADPANIFGWKNAFVAECDGMVAGAATAYVMPPAEGGDDASTAEAAEFKHSFPGFVPVFELFSLAEGDWFLDSIAVHEHMRSRGIASMLTDHCMERGRQSGCEQASLVVEDGNLTALSLYERKGFVTIADRPYEGNGNGGSSDHWLLMARPIGG